MAVQHNILHALLTPALKALLPSLANLDPLAEEWSNGVQYFLNQVPAHWEQYVGRSMITLDSPWSIVFMIQTNRGPWQNVSLPAGVEGVLSAVMSNVANPGVVHGKTFNKCTADEILEEVLTQIGLDDVPAAIDYGVVGPNIDYITRADYNNDPDRYNGYAVSEIPNTNMLLVNDGLMYVRAPGNRMIEPENKTDMNNLFVTGEFTQTVYSIPTMEKSNESGKRAAKSIYEAVGLAFDPDRIAVSDLPFRWLRRFDNWLFGLGRNP